MSITVKMGGETFDLTTVIRYKDPQTINQEKNQKKRDRQNRWYADLKKDPVRYREYLNRISENRKTPTKR